MTTRDFACNNPRIATDYENRNGQMVYEVAYVWEDIRALTG